jgi:hypothetical protein
MSALQRDETNLKTVYLDNEPLFDQKQNADDGRIKIEKSIDEVKKKAAR